MGLDEAMRQVRGGAGRPLLFERILGRLCADDAQRVIEWVAGGVFSCREIAEALTLAGHAISESAVRTYQARQQGKVAA